MSSESKPVLAMPRSYGAVENAFEGDRFSRLKMAERLTEYVDRLRHGAVIGIDAPWGSGKTWFGRNWAKQLESTHKVVYIDAFESDYIEDPFLLVAAEVAKILDDGQGAGKTLREKAAKVAQVLMPAATKAMIKTAGKVIGIEDAPGLLKEASETLTEGASEAAEKWIEQKLQNYDAEKASLQHFRDEIGKYAKKQSKPVVFLIDELDRCRPSFAVRLLERIKHFFDVPNLVFVLLLNRRQLEQAVKGVYGESTDATAYLSKFVQFFLTLPRPNRDEGGDSEPLKEFIFHQLERHGVLTRSPDLTDFVQSMAYFATSADLTLRELERAVPLYILAGQPRASGAVAFLIFLKVRHPDLFNGIVGDDKAAHESAAKLMQELTGKSRGGADSWPGVYYESVRISLYIAAGIQTVDSLGADHRRNITNILLNTQNARLETVFKRVGSLLDFTVTN